MGIAKDTSNTYSPQPSSSSPSSTTTTSQSKTNGVTTSQLKTNGVNRITKSLRAIMLFSSINLILTQIQF